MSINHFMNKIKGNLGIDSRTIVCLFIIILVGLSSFGLGRLSISKNDESDSIILDNNISSDVKEEIGNSQNIKKDLIETENQKEKMYIASKNGKLYYGVTCSGAKRISAKNEIWFKSKEDAEKAGYTLSSSCK